MREEGSIPGKIHAVLVRYIIIFILFAVVLFMLFTPLYFYIFNYTRTNELSYMTDRLKSGVHAIDSTVAVLNSMVLFTRQDSRFRAVNEMFPNAETDPFALSELRGIFNSFLQTQPLVVDAGIIFSQNIILSTRQLFYYLEYYTYYNLLLSCEDLSWDEWTAFLKTNMPFGPVKTYRSSMSGAYRALTFSAHPAGTSGNSFLIFATLALDSLIALIADNETASAGIVRISDSSGALLYAHDRSGGKPCHTIEAECSQTSLRFEVGIPDTIINEKLKPVKNLIFIFALITTLLGIILSLVFAQRSSTPIRKFLASLEATKNIKNKNLGYFQSLGQIYSDLAANISVVDARLEASLRTIENQTQILRSQIFDRAINQGIYDAEEKALFLNMFPDFPEQYQLGVIHYDIATEGPQADTASHNTAAIQISFQISLLNLIKKQLDGIFMQGVNGNKIVMLLPANGDCQDWYARFQLLRNELNRQSDLSLTCALSGFFDKPSDLVRAWNQLELIHMAAGINDLVSVQDIKHFPVSDVRFPLDLNMFQMIYNALSNGNEVTACAILKERWDASVLADEPSLAELFYRLLKDTVMVLKMKNPMLLFDVEIPVYINRNQDELFLKQFPECFKQITLKIKNAKQEGINEFSRQILEFINEHLFDPALYINMVSDHFNISAPTLQKLLRPLTGKTFLAYVEGKRLEKAREMLASGKYTVIESARASGFSNKNSFYIAFKKAYGFPPSDILGKKIE